MEANAGESFQMQILSNIFPRISLHCKLVPVQYREYEYGLILRALRTVPLRLKGNLKGIGIGTSITLIQKSALLGSARILRKVLEM